jgi:hypothetical protein
MRRSFCIPSMRRQISGPKHRSCTARTGNPRNSSALGGIMHVQLIGQACAPLLAAIMPAHGGLARAPSPCLRPCSFRRRCNDVWPCSLRRWWFGLAPSPYAPAAHAHGALPHDVWPCSLRRCWFGPSACALAGPHSALPPPSCNDVWPCSLRRCWCGPSAGPIYAPTADPVAFADAGVALAHVHLRGHTVHCLRAATTFGLVAFADGGLARAPSPQRPRSSSFLRPSTF